MRSIPATPKFREPLKIEEVMVVGTVFKPQSSKEVVITVLPQKRKLERPKLKWLGLDEKEEQLPKKLEEKLEAIFTLKFESLQESLKEKGREVEKLNLKNQKLEESVINLKCELQSVYEKLSKAIGMIAESNEKCAIATTNTASTLRRFMHMMGLRSMRPEDITHNQHSCADTFE